MSISHSNSAEHRRYVLIVLTAVYTLNFLDRNLLILLLQPIKEDLHLSDTQLGFLTGIAFGLFYATLGLPIARWADTGNRARIVSLAIGLWGATVMSCLWVKTFLQLILTRVAAAVGESGCLPPAYSLLGDYFPAPQERTRAMSVYWMGVPISALVSFVVGGWLNEHFGWRITFFVMGIPGLLMAVVVGLTIVEPRVTKSLTATRPPRMMKIVRLLWQRRATRHLGIAIILYFMLGLGLGPWYAAFMIRSHGMGTQELGLWLGLIWSLSGVIGLWLGGQASSRWLPSENSQLRLMAAVVGALAPCYAAFLLVPTKQQALLALIPLSLVNNFVLGPTFALLQRLVKDDMRATALAVVMLLANLIGMGFGPQIVGILSDRMAPAFGNNALRYAMLTLSGLALWAACHLWLASRTVNADLDALAQTSAGVPASVALPT